MKNVPLLLATIFGTLLLIFGVGFLFSKQTASNTTGQIVDQAALVGEGRLAKGPATAPVTIVEFSDLQCPACKATYPLVKQVGEEFGDNVRIVYRHMPLDSIHPNARTAAAASEVAHSYGKFWEMHDILFEKQEEWADISDEPALKEKFAEYAQQLQIDKTEFLTKIEEQSFADLVQADSVAGLQLGVASTPTFYVNGTKTPAPQLKTVVQSILDQNGQ